MTGLAETTKSQIDSLSLEPGRPLVVTDADEVLLSFVGGLERFLAERELVFDMASYRIHGNIRRRDSGEAVPDEEVSALLKGYSLSPHWLAMEPIPGAPEALARLSQNAQIVVLTNMPAHRVEDRTRCLARHDLHYPVIANEGGLKGPALAHLAARARAPVAFLDDLPPNIVSARQAVPRSRLIHFLGEPRLAPHLPTPPEADHRIMAWDEALQAIQGWLRGI
jgi:hypothetical protein